MPPAQNIEASVQSIEIDNIPFIYSLDAAQTKRVAEKMNHDLAHGMFGIPVLIT